MSNSSAATAFIAVLGTALATFVGQKGGEAASTSQPNGKVSWKSLLGYYEADDEFSGREYVQKETKGEDNTVLNTDVASLIDSNEVDDHAGESDLESHKKNGEGEQGRKGSQVKSERKSKEVVDLHANAQVAQTPKKSSSSSSSSTLAAGAMVTTTETPDHPVAVGSPKSVLHSVINSAREAILRFTPRRVFHQAKQDTCNQREDLGGPKRDSEKNILESEGDKDTTIDSEAYKDLPPLLCLDSSECYETAIYEAIYMSDMDKNEACFGGSFDLNASSSHSSENGDDDEGIDMFTALGQLTQAEQSQLARMSSKEQPHLESAFGRVSIGSSMLNGFVDLFNVGVNADDILKLEELQRLSQRKSELQRQEQQQEQRQSNYAYSKAVCVSQHSRPQSLLSEDIQVSSPKRETPSQSSNLPSEKEEDRPNLSPTSRRVSPYDDISKHRTPDRLSILPGRPSWAVKTDFVARSSAANRRKSRLSLLPKARASAIYEAPVGAFENEKVASSSLETKVETVQAPTPELDDIEVAWSPMPNICRKSSSAEVIRRRHSSLWAPLNTGLRAMRLEQVAEEEDNESEVIVPTLCEEREECEDEPNKNPIHQHSSTSHDDQDSESQSYLCDEYYDSVYEDEDEDGYGYEQGYEEEDLYHSEDHAALEEEIEMDLGDNFMERLCEMASERESIALNETRAQAQIKETLQSDEALEDHKTMEVSQIESETSEGEAAQLPFSFGSLSLSRKSQRYFGQLRGSKSGDLEESPGSDASQKCREQEHSKHLQGEAIAENSETVPSDSTEDVPNSRSFPHQELKPEVVFGIDFDPSAFTLFGNESLSVVQKDNESTRAKSKPTHRLRDSVEYKAIEQDPLPSVRRFESPPFAARVPLSDILPFSSNPILEQIASMASHKQLSQRQSNQKNTSSTMDQDDTLGALERENMEHTARVSLSSLPSTFSPHR